MNRSLYRWVFPGVAALALLLSPAAPVAAQNPAADEAARIQRGFLISPVKLKLKNRDRNLIGLGSYIVNAQGGCNDCHTDPPYAPGGDPFQGEPEQINTARYLAGGRAFGPFISANITPDEDGKPHGLTFQEFRAILRSGHEPGEPLLQVMPWPVYRNMTDRDLKAIYAYLSAIPSIP
jgi:hypothetical protein